MAAGRRRGAAAKRAALSKKFDPDLLDDPDEIELKRIKSEPETQIPGDDLDDNEDMFAEGNDNDEDYEPFEKFDLVSLYVFFLLHQDPVNNIVKLTSLKNT